MDRGEKHITDLRIDRYRHKLREEGGNGYTIRFVGKEWSIYNYAYNSLHPILSFRTEC